MGNSWDAGFNPQHCKEKSQKQKVKDILATQLIQGHWYIRSRLRERRKETLEAHFPSDCSSDATSLSVRANIV